MQKADNSQHMDMPKFPMTQKIIKEFKQLKDALKKMKVKQPRVHGRQRWAIVEIIFNCPKERKIL